MSAESVASRFAHSPSNPRFRANGLLLTRCAPVFGECSHIFHMHCLLKWINTESSKQQCPMDRQPWGQSLAISPLFPVTDALRSHRRCSRTPSSSDERVVALLRLIFVSKMYNRSDKMYNRSIEVSHFARENAQKYTDTALHVAPRYSRADASRQRSTTWTECDPLDITTFSRCCSSPHLVPPFSSSVASCLRLRTAI